MATLELAYAYAIPFLLEQATSPEILTGGWNALVPLLELLAGLLLLMPVVTYGSYLRRITANRGIGALREALFDHLMYLPMEQAEALKAGDALTLMNSDVEQAGGLFKSYALTNLFRFLLLFPLSFAAVATHNLRMALAALVLCVLFLAFTLAFNPIIRRLKRQGQEILTEIASSLLGLHRGMVVARVFGLGPALLTQYLRICQTLSRVRVRTHVTNGLIGMVLHLFRSTAKPLAFLFGLLLVMRGEESVPSIVFIAGMAGVMADASQSLYSFLLYIQSSLASAQRVFRVLDLPAEALRQTTAPPAKAPGNALSFQGVSFA
ncbi:MAG TPA: ABC transporter transmembrane domain-containing protein, partial [Clostridia bacterium]|nr:ABC transporter transmembrane domain-containing protein [Clostridia bacterium]